MTFPDVYWTYWYLEAFAFLIRIATKVTTNLLTTQNSLQRPLRLTRTQMIKLRKQPQLKNTQGYQEYRQHQNEGINTNNIHFRTILTIIIGCFLPFHTLFCDNYSWYIIFITVCFIFIGGTTRIVRKKKHMAIFLMQTTQINLILPN